MMTSLHPCIASTPAARRTQEGVVLFVALIVLVAMTLAGLGMMRSADTNNIIAGNLALKNASISAGDAAIEAARNWLGGQTSGALENNFSPMGYFANWDPSFDPQTFDWLAQSKFVGEDANKNRLYVVVHRMCNESGKSINLTPCVKVAQTGVGKSQGLGSGGYGLNSPSVANIPYYRITAKIEGPKNTVSYLQGFVY